MKFTIKQKLFLAVLLVLIVGAAAVRALDGTSTKQDTGSVIFPAAGNTGTAAEPQDEGAADISGTGRTLEDILHAQDEAGTAASDSQIEREEVVEDNYKASAELLRRLKSELGDVMDACRSVYTNADTGTALNAVLSSSDQRAMVRAIAEKGYAAVDYTQTFSMQGYENLLEFCDAVNFPALGDISGTFYFVFTDGQISQYTLLREDGVWHLVTLTGTWSRDRTPTIGSDAAFPVTGIRYSDKGRLMFQRSLTGLNDLEQANSAAWIFVKVTPSNADMQALCARYIEPIGYFENNFFTTNWGPGYMNPVDFNSLYAYLFKMYTGTDTLTSYNVYSYYKPVENTGMYLIPTETFEKVVDNFFDIDHTTLRSISDYSSSDGGYYFLGYRLDYYSVTPRTPSPEVVDFWYNDDGTLTMRVDAVNKWYGTDRAFTHDVTVSIDSNGDFKYVSNTLHTYDNTILPENKLSTLRRAKLDVYLDK